MGIFVCYPGFSVTWPRRTAFTPRSGSWPCVAASASSSRPRCSPRPRGRPSMKYRRCSTSMWDDWSVTNYIAVHFSYFFFTNYPDRRRSVLRKVMVNMVVKFTFIFLSYFLFFFFNDITSLITIIVTTISSTHQMAIV